MTSSTTTVATAVSSAPLVQLSGNFMGGQQPVSSLLVQLYAVSSAGDGSPASPLLNRVVTTTATGQFTFTAADFTCPSASTPVYIVGTGEIRALRER